jgi:ADP-heptose:LPS heptosyltransferase
MKILIVQIGRIGDTVLTTPMFRAVADHLPGAAIHVLASPRGFPVLRGNPHIKKVIVYRKDPISLLFIFLRLRLAGYDWLIDPKDHPSREGALLARICRAKNKVGYNSEGGKTFSFGIPSQNENAALHAVTRNLACLGALGVSCNTDCRPELFPDARLARKIRDSFPQDAAKTVLLNISAGNASRYWIFEKWAQAAAFCLARGHRVLVAYQPSDSRPARALHDLQPGVILYHSSTIGEIIALMPLVNLVVTLDTSVVHIASAFDVPQIALFPDVEWNLKKFRPLSSLSVVVQPEKGEMVSTIPVERVIGEIEKLNISNHVL